MIYCTDQTRGHDILHTPLKQTSGKAAPDRSMRTRYASRNFQFMGKITQALGQEKQQQDRNVENFFRLKVLPAFEEFKTVLEEQGREVTIGQGLEEVTIKVMFKGEEEIKYGVQAKVYGTRVVVHPVQFFSEEGQRYKGEGFFRSGIQNYNVDDLTKEEIIQHLLSEYKSRLQYLAQNR